MLEISSDGELTLYSYKWLKRTKELPKSPSMPMREMMVPTLKGTRSKPYH